MKWKFRQKLSQKTIYLTVSLISFDGALDFENLSRLDGFVTSNLAHRRLNTRPKTAYSS